VKERHPHLKEYFWNPSENRLRTGWRLLLQLSLNLGGAIAFSLWVVPHTFLNSWPRLAVEAIGYPVLLGITLLSVWLAGRFLDKRAWRDFGLTLTQRVWWEDFAVGFGIGFLLIVLFMVAVIALGIIRLNLTFTSGLPRVSFPVAVLLGLLSYGAVGFFEELGRAYQMRNLFEAFSGTRLGLRGAALASAVGAALVSAVMHSSGAPLFILFVIVSMSIQGLFYLFTGRTALITGYHIAWDFALSTVFGIEALTQSEYTGLFTPQLTSLVEIVGNEVHIANYLPLVLTGVAVIVLQVVAWLALLGWVYWRTGGVRVRADMARPTLLSTKGTFNERI
jgi:membrane protease YdiL (CAAX protease family)